MAQSLVWLETDQIIQKVPCTCIDGRTPGPRHSVAGGSFGLVVHALALIQRRLGRNFQVADIEAYMRLFAAEVAPLYLHTDQHHLDCIHARLGLPAETRLSDLNAAQRRSFCELAARPECQGCGHLALMMTHEAEYGVPARLIGRALTAFLRLYFAATPGLVFDVLAGRHREARAVLLDAAPGEGRAPLYREAPGEANGFFCHRPLKRALVERLARALATSDLPGLSEAECQALLAEHDTAAERTLARLAPELPIDHLVLTTEETA